MSTAAVPFAIGGEPAIMGEAAGAGTPVVLCHGLTATRRYVIHGSRALERAGHRVVSYDARAHGESGPAPVGAGYGFDELVGDLEAVVERAVGEGRFVLAGHSMGAHTAVAYALRRPQRLAGLVVICPVYDGEIPGERLAFWDGLAAALERGGVDGFLSFVDREQGLDPRWRARTLRFTRERMLLHRHLGALAEAIRQVPRSRPFGSLAELESVRLPALVVASQDAADPGHPRRVAEAYAERLPEARLAGEAAGETPLAWQGGRLARTLAGFCAEAAVGARLSGVPSA